MASPDKITASVEVDVKCGSKKDERIISVVPRLSNDNLKKGNDNSWMFQLFKGDRSNRPQNRFDAVYDKDEGDYVYNPDWINKDDLRDDWSNKAKGDAPPAYRVTGSGISFKVDRTESEKWTVFMWPGESNDSDDTDIDNEAGLDFGPKKNNNYLKSLCGIRFKSDEENIDWLFARGVEKVRDQRTNGSGDDSEYLVNYTYLWSGKPQYNDVSRSGGRDVYWYIIDAGVGKIDTEDKKCDGDTPPKPTPTPTPSPTPAPNPDPDFAVSINCAPPETPLARITAGATGCDSGAKLSFQWQRKRDGTWNNIDGATRSYYDPPGFGQYRCKITCGNNVENTKSCFAEPYIPPPPPDPTPPPADDVVPDKVDWPNAPEFPGYIPSRRQLDFGSFPVNTFAGIRGNELRLMRGNTRSGGVLRLGYDDRADLVGYHFLSHYNAFAGTSNTFSLETCLETTFGGMQVFGFGPNSPARNITFVARGRWRYQRAPQITSVRPGISNTEIVLEEVRGSGQGAGLKDINWPNYPGFPDIDPTDRKFSPGDWNTERFAGPDSIDVGRVTSPQRNARLSLIYANIKDEVGLSFQKHWNKMHGDWGAFPLPKAFFYKGGPFVGWLRDMEGEWESGELKKKWFQQSRWTYIRCPQMQSVQKGICTMTVELRCPFPAMQYFIK